MAMFNLVPSAFDWKKVKKIIFRSPGREELPPASALASALSKCKSFYVKLFYVIGKALSGGLSCLCDRSCWLLLCLLIQSYIQIQPL